MLVAALIASLALPQDLGVSAESPRAPAMSTSAPGLRVIDQVIPNWRVQCDNPEIVRQRVSVDLTLDAEGRIVAGPTPVGPRNDPHWRAAADAAVRGLRETAPFDVPAGYTGRSYRAVFDMARVCASD